MASTYKPVDAFDFSKTMINKMKLEQVEVRILDTAMKVFWMAAPWRWTIGALPNITLLAATQSYPIALPADFLYGLECVQTDQAGGTPRDILVVPAVKPGGLIGGTSQIAFSGVSGTMGTALITPIPGTLPVPQYLLSLYKKQAPTLTASNIYTKGIQVFDDEYFHVFESGVLWASYLYADDQRAGSAQADNKGGYSFTGQRAIFEANIEWMREREPMHISDPRNVPDTIQRGR